MSNVPLFVWPVGPIINTEPIRYVVNKTDHDLVVDALREQNRVLKEAVIWALGYHDFRERQEGEGPYWWRRELMHRSGLTQGDLDQAMRLDETAEQLTDIMLQHKKKAALTATSQPVSKKGDYSHHPAFDEYGEHR